MRTKKFIASLAPGNSVKVFDAEFGTLLRTIKVEGTITTQPVIVGNELTIEIKKENILHKNVYNLPQGTLKDSQVLDN